jgi:hypothetical protein
MDGREHGRHARLVVEVPGDDESIGKELRLRIDGDDVADVDAERERVRRRACHGVHPELHELPADRLRVDRLVVRVPGCLERQDAAPVGPLLREQRHPRAFGEAGGPVADRHQLQPAVFLHPLDLRAEGVQVRDDRPGAGRLATGPDRPDGPATGQLRAQSEALELFRAVANDGVGVAARARDGEELPELLHQVFDVDP